MAEYISAQGFEYGVKHFYNDRPGLITDILYSTLHMDQDQSLHLLNLGAVYVNNQRQSSDTFFESGKLFRVHTKPRRFPTDYNWLEHIVFNHSDFLVLNKPAFIPSHPSVDNILDNSLTQLELATEEKLFITHRLDTLTEGLIVYAKNSAFVKHFNTLLQTRQIEKKYSCLVSSEKALPEKLIHYMQPSPRAPKVVSEIAEKDWLMCELIIEKQEALANVRRLKINLLTGRTHQIRVQLAAMKSPILGDKLYHSAEEWKTKGIALRACELQFTYKDQIFKFSLPEFSLPEFNIPRA